MTITTVEDAGYYLIDGHVVSLGDEQVVSYRPDKDYFAYATEQEMMADFEVRYPEKYAEYIAATADPSDEE